MKYQYVAIEGCIGAGKTTLAQKLAGDLRVRLILERFENNPFLPQFYADPARHAFPVELYFMAERFQQLKALGSEPDIFKTITISDFIFQKSYIFAMINLSEAEAKLYKTLFDIIHPNLPKPDLILYLYASADKLMANIRRRGRDYEQNISAAYLNNIQQAYLSYFKYQTGTRILLLDTAALNFQENEADYQKICDVLDKEYPEGIIYL